MTIEHTVAAAWRGLRGWSKTIKIVAVVVPQLLATPGEARSATADIPVVGCPMGGQAEEDAKIAVDRKPMELEPQIADKLAFYSHAKLSGVLAPLGWHCYLRFGSGGTRLSVAQKANKTFFDFPGDEPQVHIYPIEADFYINHRLIAFFTAHLFEGLAPKVDRFDDDGADKGLPRCPRWLTEGP